MKNYKILLFGILILNSFNSAISQEYDEQKTKLQVEKFKENPKLYYDKIKALTDKLEQANQNTLKVSEEYLLLLDKKDSIIAIYKNQLAKAKMKMTSRLTRNMRSSSALIFRCANPLSSGFRTVR